MSNGGNEELGEILERLDMESWLDREGITYKVGRGARGEQANIKECPVCGSSNWKVFFGLETGFGNCFSGDCETKFNKWSFIKASLGALSSREVVQHIKAVATEQGWRAPRLRTAAVNLETDLVMPESVSLPINGRNLKYLENRNITVTIAQYFNLRMCLKGSFKYKDDEGKDRTQSYSKRIILPIFDLDGDMVSFQGRDITGEADKKYLFPPGFSATGSHLYNGQNAHGAEDVVIGEGAFDVMATKIALDGQMELRGVVPIGSFGKHLSNGGENSQLEKLIKLKEGGLKRVTIMWDGEDKAIDAAIETGLLLRAHGFIARVAILPSGKDPNEVAASVVRDAYWKAETVTQSVAARMKISRRLA
jgi:DNA primase